MGSHSPPTDPRFVPFDVGKRLGHEMRAKYSQACANKLPRVYTQREASPTPTSSRENSPLCHPKRSQRGASLCQNSISSSDNRRPSSPHGPQRYIICLQVHKRIASYTPYTTQTIREQSQSTPQGPRQGKIKLSLPRTQKI